MTENKDNKKYKVYIYENKTNGKKYIGITCNSLKVRSGCNGSGYKQCTAFWNAIQKYGWDNFSCKVLKDNLTRSEACELEIQLIKKYHTQVPSGYNISIGGDCARAGLKFTEEQLKKMSENNKLARKVICITTNKIYNSLTSAGKDCGTSDENIARACKTGIAAGCKNGVYLHWAYLNEDGSYEQVIYTYKKRNREVFCITTNKFFNSMKEAAEYYNIKSDRIYQCCVGKNKTGGKLPDRTPLKWMYYEDYLKLKEQDVA